MASERAVTIRLDLKPGDTSAVQKAFADAQKNVRQQQPQIHIPPPPPRIDTPRSPFAVPLRSQPGYIPPISPGPQLQREPAEPQGPDIFKIAQDRTFTESKAQAAQPTFSLAPPQGIGKAAAQKPQNLPSYAPTVKLATEQDLIDKALLDAKRGLRDEAIKQLAAERRATLLAREKERLAPTVGPAPLTGFSGFLQRIGRLGEKVDPEVRLGAGKLAGAGFLASQVGRTIGGGVGTGFANTGGGGLAAAGTAVATGMAGFAAGGPIGAAIALIPTAVEAIKDFASLPYERMAGGLRALTGAMGELGGGLGAGGAVLSGMASIARLTPLVGSAMGDAIDSLKSALSAGTGMAALFSPGTMERFRIVQQDTMATIGRTFTPILEVLTDFTRLAGDFLATVLPGTREMRDALSPLKDVFRELRTSLGEMAPALKSVLVDALRSLTPLFQSLGETLKDLAPLVEPAIRLMQVELEKTVQEVAKEGRFQVASQEEFGPAAGLLGPIARLGMPLADIPLKLAGIKGGFDDVLKQHFKDRFEQRQVEAGIGGPTKEGASAGMAARNISFTSSGEDAARQVYQAVYRNAPRETTESLLASGNKTQEQALGVLQQIARSLSTIGLGGNNSNGDSGGFAGGVGGFLKLAERATAAIMGAR